jgi:hypothetical protein
MASIINVDKVRATGSTTDGLVVDSTGRVTQPALPAWSAYNSTGAYINTSPIVLNSTEVNRGSIYNTSTGVVTIPVAGVYCINCYLYVRVNNSEDGTLRLQKSTDGGSNFSNVTYAYCYTTGVTEIHVTVTLSHLLDLSANDQLRITFGGSGDYYSGSQESRFSGFLLG